MLDRSLDRRIVAPAIGPAENTIWKSGLTMAHAPFDSNATVSHDAPIDPAYTRTYVEYWIKAFRMLGEPVRAQGNCAGAAFKTASTRTVVLYRFPNDPSSCSLRIEGESKTFSDVSIGWNTRSW